MTRKIVVGVIFFSVVMLTVAGLQFWTLRRLQDESRALECITVDNLTCSAWINSYQAEGFAHTMELLNTDTPTEQATLLASIQSYSDKNDASIKEYTKKFPPDRSRDVLDRFMAKRQQYVKIRLQMIELLKQNHKPEAVQLANTSLRQAYNDYTRAGDDLLSEDIQSARTHSEIVSKLSSITLVLVPAIGLLGLLIGSLIPLLILNSMARALEGSPKSN